MMHLANFEQIVNILGLLLSSEVNVVLKVCWWEKWGILFGVMRVIPLSFICYLIEDFCHVMIALFLLLFIEDRIFTQIKFSLEIFQGFIKCKNSVLSDHIWTIVNQSIQICHFSQPHPSSAFTLPHRISPLFKIDFASADRIILMFPFLFFWRNYFLSDKFVFSFENNIDWTILFIISHSFDLVVGYLYKRCMDLEWFMKQEN